MPHGTLGAPTPLPHAKARSSERGARSTHRVVGSGLLATTMKSTMTAQIFTGRGRGVERKGDAWPPSSLPSTGARGRALAAAEMGRAEGGT